MSADQPLPPDCQRVHDQKERYIAGDLNETELAEFTEHVKKCPDRCYPMIFALELAEDFRKNPGVFHLKLLDLSDRVFCVAAVITIAMVLGVFLRHMSWDGFNNPLPRTTLHVLLGTLAVSGSISLIRWTLVYRRLKNRSD